jgi:hypothetical protein
MYSQHYSLKKCLLICQFLQPPKPDPDLSQMFGSGSTTHLHIRIVCQEMWINIVRTFRLKFTQSFRCYLSVLRSRIILIRFPAREGKMMRLRLRNTANYYRLVHTVCKRLADGRKIFKRSVS